MRFTGTSLSDVWLIDVEPHGDERGLFARTMCREEFGRHGLIAEFVQINTSHSARRGTLRGLHFQRDPFAEAKLVRCLRGAIWDVVVDLRAGSPSFLRHQGFELTADNRTQLYAPPGFAHGFVTLTDDVEVSYPVSAPYTPGAGGGVRFDDPLLSISWPAEVTAVSDKDRSWPPLRAEQAPFRWHERVEGERRDDAA